MKIAICGIRGIPACYGGFETFAEELSTRLVEQNHEVIVYGRNHVIKYEQPFYKGVRIKLLPAPKHKYFETPIHTLRCLIDLVRNPVDVILVCNAANSPFLFIPRLFGAKIAINLDGIERMRAKWNMLGRLWYRLGEVCSTLFAQQLISDADVIRDYYLKSYGAESAVIRYGYRRTDDTRVDAKVFSGTCSSFDEKERALFQELGIEPHKFVLYVSRLEPENNAHVVIEAYNQIDPALKRSMPLVIVGDAPYSDEYIRHLRRIAGENVIFTGYRFGKDYQTLQLSAYCYVQATEVGGTHPALVEAMGYGNAVISNETPENVEVLSDAGAFYKKNNKEHLASLLTRFISEPLEVAKFQKLALNRARSLFDWEKITSEYQELFASLLEGRPYQPQVQPGEERSVGNM